MDETGHFEVDDPNPLKRKDIESDWTVEQPNQRQRTSDGINPVDGPASSEAHSAVNAAYAALYVDHSEIQDTVGDTGSVPMNDAPPPGSEQVDDGVTDDHGSMAAVMLAAAAASPEMVRTREKTPDEGTSQEGAASLLNNGGEGQHMGYAQGGFMEGMVAGVSAAPEPLMAPPGKDDPMPISPDDLLQALNAQTPPPKAPGSHPLPPPDSGELEGGAEAPKSDGKILQCEQCGKGFKKLYHLTAHMRIHTGEKPWTCQHCGRAFRERGHLNAHTRIHTGERPFECNVCNKTFIVSSSLTTHMRTHTGEKPYKCSLCDRAFSVLISLTKHMRTHTKEKPYQCDECGKRFSESGGLSKHKRTHQAKAEKDKSDAASPPPGVLGNPGGEMVVSAVMDASDAMSAVVGEGGMGAAVAAAADAMVAGGAGREMVAVGVDGMVGGADGEMSAAADNMVVSPEGKSYQALVASPGEMVANPADMVTTPAEMVGHPGEMMVANPAEMVTTPAEMVANPAEMVTTPAEIVGDAGDMVDASSPHGAEMGSEGLQVDMANEMIAVPTGDEAAMEHLQQQIEPQDLAEAQMQNMDQIKVEPVPVEQM